MKKIIFRVTSIVLVLSMLFSIVPPNSILAAQKDRENN